MEDIVDPESKSIKLKHSYALIPDALKRPKVKDDDLIVTKHEVFDEDVVNQRGDWFDVDVPSVTRQFKTYSPSNSTTFLPEVLDEEYECVNLSVSANIDSFNKRPQQILKCQRNNGLCLKEMENEKRICRLCFKICGGKFKTIDGDIKVVLDKLLPGIAIDAIPEPVMCSLCAEIIFESFDFKAKCLYTQSYLIPYFNKKSGVKVNLKDIYMTKNKNSIPEDEDICGFCMSPVKESSVLFIDVEERDNMLKKTLEQCIPELNLNIIKEHVICAPCNASLEKYSRFVTNVLIVEEKIKKYGESLDVNSKSQIEIRNLLQCIKGISGVCDNEGAIIKSEQMSCDYSESVNTDIENKLNSSMDMKFDNDQKFTPKNILIYEMESSELGAIEMKETFCGQARMEVKGENVEIEEQKFFPIEEIEIKTDELDYNRCEEGIVVTQEIAIARLHEKREYPVLPNFDVNLLKPKVEQTFTKKNVTNIIMYQCECCPFVTQNKYFLTRHLQKHTDISKVTIYRCDLCLYGTKHKSKLKEHFLRHKSPSEVTMYKCDSCAFQTKYKRNLKSHSLNHKNISGVTMYKCDTCLYETKYMSRLKKHFLKHKTPSEVTLYKCDSCSHQTKYKHTLKKHLLKHRNISEITMYKCDSCLYQTKYKSDHKTHLLKHKAPSEVTVHKCDSCAYQTIFKGNLKQHLLTHKDISEVTIYKCDSCVYQTKYKTALKSHSMNHRDISEVTMYKCDLCLYRTKYKSELKRHFLNHKSTSEVTMFKCDSCAYQTVRKNILKRHLLKHKDISEVTMHICDLCLYQTKYKSNLKNHLLTHKNP